MFFVHVSGGLGMRMEVGCPCPPVRNDIVTPCHLLIDFWTEHVRLSLDNITKPDEKKASPIHRFLTFGSNLGILIWPDHHKILGDSNA